jgi:hypothetical protein
MDTTSNKISTPIDSLANRVASCEIRFRHWQGVFETMILALHDLPPHAQTVRQCFDRRRARELSFRREAAGLRVTPLI